MSTAPHVIMIVADSLRYDTVSPLDLPTLTARGIRFTQARSAGCWTGPATASLFTGLMPHEHRLETRSRQGLPARIPTLAERLRENGYGTHQVTANVVTTNPFGLDRGFDTVDRVWQRMTEKSQTWENALLMIGKPRIRKGLLNRLLGGDDFKQRINEDMNASRVWFRDTCDLVFDGARQLLNAHRRHNKPGFIFLNLMESHFPYHIGPELSMIDNDPFSIVREYFTLFQFVNQSWLKKGQMTISPAMLARLKDRQWLAWQRLAPKLDEFVREIDQQKDTIIIFLSDHGDCFGEDGSAYHFGNVTDGGNRVPLYWIHPDQSGERTIDTPVSTRDLFHTILANTINDRREDIDLTRNPERSNAIMQANWYNADNRTDPRYRHDQFAFVDGKHRFMYRRGTWHVAGLTTTEQEEPWQALSPDFSPIMCIADKYRRFDLKVSFHNFRAFSAKLAT